MFKSLTIVGAAFVVSLSSVSLADENDLFTEFPSSSVFNETSGNTTSGNSTTRITNAEQLRELLKVGGFDAKVADSRGVTTEKQLAPWTFPVMAVLSEDEANVTIILGLGTITNITKELPADTLLKLMAASQKHTPNLFAYNAERTRTELSFTLKNADLSSQLLREEVNRMAVLAKTTSALWDNSERSNTNAPATPTRLDPALTNPTVSLTGQWSAAKSDKQAFDVDLKADGTFNLVYLNNGQQTKSSGKFTSVGGLLILTGDDGLKFQGKLIVRSDSEFRFEPLNSTVLVFNKTN